MKFGVIMGVQPSVALESYHPDHQSHENAPNELLQHHNQRASAAELEDGVQKDLPLATSGALGTQLNLLV